MAVMRVPSLAGLRELRTKTGMILLHGGEDGGGVQDLGAEVGELGGLFKADGLDAQGVGADARIGGHDAVDVGPDFDGAGVEAAADEGGGVVASRRGRGWW